MSGQYQKVKLCEEKCPSKLLIRGIPQGSGFDPMILHIIMNDILYFIEKMLTINFTSSVYISTSV